MQVSVSTPYASMKAELQALKPAPGPCTQEDCPYTVFASGLCRKHYGAKWRAEHRANIAVVFVPKSHNFIEDLKGELICVETVLDEMRQHLEKVTGLETRLSWRVRIRNAENERRRLLKELQRAST